jgi:hypothetical protein
VPGVCVGDPVTLHGRGTTDVNYDRSFFYALEQGKPLGAVLVHGRPLRGIRPDRCGMARHPHHHAGRA